MLNRSPARVPGTKWALLSTPSKMPGWSWDLPAKRSCPGAVFGAGAVCDSCYANGQSNKEWHRQDGTTNVTKRGGSYGYPNVIAAQDARYQWTLRCLMTPEGRQDWVNYMVSAIRICAMNGQTYFRIHSSGDWFSPQYVKMWQLVAEQLPEVMFWAPTRSYHSTPRILDALREIATLPNVTIRPSALYTGESAPVVDGLHAGSTVVRAGYTCPASKQGNACMGCRFCWLEKDQVVSYPLH